MLSNILISSSQGNISPEWLLSQDVDTINYITEQCDKLLESEVEYKKTMLEASAKKVM